MLSKSFELQAPEGGGAGRLFEAWRGGRLSPDSLLYLTHTKARLRKHSSNISAA